MEGNLFIEWYKNDKKEKCVVKIKKKIKINMFFY